MKTLMFTTLIAGMTYLIYLETGPFTAALLCFAMVFFVKGAAMHAKRDRQVRNFVRFMQGKGEFKP